MNMILRSLNFNFKYFLQFFPYTPITDWSSVASPQLIQSSSSVSDPQTTPHTVSCSTSLSRSRSAWSAPSCGSTCFSKPTRTSASERGGRWACSTHAAREIRWRPSTCISERAAGKCSTWPTPSSSGGEPMHWPPDWRFVSKTCKRLGIRT